MKPSLIDTDILSEFFRGNEKVVDNADKYLQEYPSLNFSIITYYEILNGLLYKDATRQLLKFSSFVESNTVLLLSVQAATIAAQLYADLRKRRETIGHTDSLIAGIALANDLYLVTNNTKHFQRVEGLKLSNWMK
jgi:predicted nucleic acid-binding protein